MIPLFSQPQNNINNSNYYLRLTNLGAYIASFFITYTINGRSYCEQGPLIPVLQSSTLYLPTNATDIYITVSKLIGFYVYSPIEQRYFRKPDKICLTSHGSLFYAWVTQEPCPSTQLGPDPLFSPILPSSY